MLVRVNIIGAGIAGICLAQILSRNNIPVAVYERNYGSRYLSEGFWIEINKEGMDALRNCLAPEHFEALLAASRPTNHPDCRWLTRAALQMWLLHGLEGVVQFDKTFVRFEEQRDARIAAYFADGSSSVADVLVAADGVHSKIRQQLLLHAKRIETGVLAVGGTADLTDEVSRLLPANAMAYPSCERTKQSANVHRSVAFPAGAGSLYRARSHKHA